MMDTVNSSLRLEHNKPSWVHFHGQNFMPSLASLVQRLIHLDGSSAWVLKIDCEGCEFDTLLPTLTAVCFELVLLEIHIAAQAARADARDA